MLDERAFKRIESKISRIVESSGIPDGDKKLMASLKQLCNAIHEVGHDVDDETICRAGDLIDRAVDWAYSEEGAFDFLPSFAHAEDRSPLVSDPGVQSLSMSPHSRHSLMGSFMASGAVPDIWSGLNSMIPRPWSEMSKPYAKSTPLARFRGNSLSWTDNGTLPLATAVMEARAEIWSDDIPRPGRLVLSSDGQCLALPFSAGWKEREPFLCYYIPSEGPDFPSYIRKVGLTALACHITTDASRKLIFIADNDRIKSFAWGSTSNGEMLDEAFPIHTMASGRRNGPLAVLSNGRLARGGQGSIAIWAVDSLPTHGTNGDKRIGKKISIEDSWIDEPEEHIERSWGSAPTGEIKLADATFEPGEWLAHPSAPEVMLCSSADQEKYNCYAIDLEHGGATAARYIGHGGEIEDLSTSSGDPNIFATAALDGYARLFDVRQPLPVFTFDSGNSSQYCPAVALAHPDGHPVLFAGTDRYEHIQMVDIRAKAMLYDLSTGNNQVVSLTWDDKRNTLYASTSCAYVNRHGEKYDYRPLRLSKGKSDWSLKEGDVGYEEDEEDKYDDDTDGQWPVEAHHSEDYYGHLFDADGYHRIYRYAFKPDPDLSILPHFYY
ncbi:hypothetical protein AX15_000783 [Amanita polypyramis BW_CC]|nr:hypothetical protein AX15_000783 [Amanita polypyramis BW_CC]